MAKLNMKHQSGRTLQKTSKDFRMQNFDKYVKDAKILSWGVDNSIKEKDKDV